MRSLEPVRPRLQGPRLRSGFSLVELVMVLAITMIITAVAAPRYANALHRYRTDAAARRVISDLALARASARAASQSRTVGFDLVNHTLSIPGVEPLDPGGGSYLVNFRDEPYRVQITRADFAGSPNVTFNGFGDAQAGGTVVLTSGSYSRVVVLNSATGEATLQ